MIQLNINAEIKKGRRRIMRPILTTTVQRQTLEKIYLQGVRIWGDSITSDLLPSYSRAVAARKLTQDDASEVSNIVDSIGNGILFALAQFSQNFTTWAIGIADWHTQKFVSQITRLTRINLSNQLTVQDVNSTITGFVESNVALLRSVSEQARGRIAELLLRNINLQTKPDKVRRELRAALQLSVDRAKRIAYDQINKFTSDLDHDRHSQLGIPGFIWEHSRKEHYRPWHKARDGQYFAWDSEVAETDPPGQAPFCGCKALGVLGT